MSRNPHTNQQQQCPSDSPPQHSLYDIKVKTTLERKRAIRETTNTSGFQSIQNVWHKPFVRSASISFQAPWNAGGCGRQWERRHRLLAATRQSFSCPPAAWVCQTHHASILQTEPLQVSKQQEWRLKRISFVLSWELVPNVRTYCWHFLIASSLFPKIVSAPIASLRFPSHQQKRYARLWCILPWQVHSRREGSRFRHGADEDQGGRKGKASRNEVASYNPDFYASQDNEEASSSCQSHQQSEATESNKDVFQEGTVPSQACHVPQSQRSPSHGSQTNSLEWTTINIPGGIFNPTLTALTDEQQRMLMALEPSPLILSNNELAFFRG